MSDHESDRERAIAAEGARAHDRIAALEAEVTRLREKNDQFKKLIEWLDAVADEMKRTEDEQWEPMEPYELPRVRPDLTMVVRQARTIDRLRAAIQTEIAGLELVAESCERSGLGASTERRQIAWWKEVLND